MYNFTSLSLSLSFCIYILLLNSELDENCTFENIATNAQTKLHQSNEITTQISFYEHSLNIFRNRHIINGVPVRTNLNNSYGVGWGLGTNHIFDGCGILYRTVWRIIRNIYFIV